MAAVNDNVTKDDRDTRSQTLRQPPGKPRPREFGGPKGPEPTRYGDWERNGRCSDF